MPNPQTQQMPKIIEFIAIYFLLNFPKESRNVRNASNPSHPPRSPSYSSARLLAGNTARLFGAFYLPFRWQLLQDTEYSSYPDHQLHLILNY